MSSRFFITFCRFSLSLLLLGFCTVAFAQSGDWADATKGVMSIYETLSKLLKIIIGIGALIVLAEIILKLMSGDKESAHKLLWWLVGLAIGFVFLEMLAGAKFI